MNWQVVLASWILIHAPIAIFVGRALKKPGFDAEASSVETAASPSSSPLPACGSRRPSYPCRMNQSAVSSSPSPSAAKINSMGGVS